MGQALRRQCPNADDRRLVGTHLGQQIAQSLGAEIRTVKRFHAANPTANRHQLIAELLDAPENVVLILDCDTFVTRDPLPHLNADAFQAKVEPSPTVSDDVFERLFAHFKLAKPARSCVTTFDLLPTIPYFNAGVLAMPKAIARTLAPVWRRYNEILANDPDLVAPCQRHMHQASLSLALAETGVPITELPVSMNFQINTPHLTPPPGFAETDPVIIHYHQFATDDGFLMPTPFPAAQKRIEAFNDRMRSEGFTRNTRASSEFESRPIIVLGMSRSGLSLVAQLIAAFGVYTGGDAVDLGPPDMYNPTGFWEHPEAVRIDHEIVGELGADWTNVANVDLAQLSGERRAHFVARAMSVVRSLQGRGPFLLKDPRMALLFPIVSVSDDLLGGQESFEEALAIVVEAVILLIALVVVAAVEPVRPRRAGFVALVSADPRSPPRG